MTLVVSTLKPMNSLPDVIDAVRPAVVKVMPTSTEVTFSSVGTGFILDKAGFVLTAAHVIEDARNGAEARGAKNICIAVGLAHPNTDHRRGEFTGIRCKVIEEDRENDLALLQMTLNPFKRAVEIKPDGDGKLITLPVDVVRTVLGRPRDGETIAVSGYPLNNDTLITTTGIVASAWAMTGGKDRYLADVTANHGNSGGPAYRIEDGMVIGVCVEVADTYITDANSRRITVEGNELAYQAGLLEIVPIKYGLEMLASHLSKS